MARDPDGLCPVDAIVELIRFRVAKREGDVCLVKTTSPQQRCRRMAPHMTTMVGVDQSMVGHILMRMSSAGVMGSLRLQG